MNDSGSVRRPPATEGVLIGRVVGELLSLRTDDGRIVSVRVRPELAMQLVLGERVLIEFDEDGQVNGVRKLAANESGASLTLQRESETPRRRLA